MMMGRQNVYHLIDGERVHQDKKHLPIDVHGHTVAEWLLIIRSELREAEEAWVRGSGDRDALDEVRQIAAVAVACMEQHGAPRREQP